MRSVPMFSRFFCSVLLSNIMLNFHFLRLPIKFSMLTKFICIILNGKAKQKCFFIKSKFPTYTLQRKYAYFYWLDKPFFIWLLLVIVCMVGAPVLFPFPFIIQITRVPIPMLKSDSNMPLLLFFFRNRPLTLNKEVSCCTLFIMQIPL